MKAVRKFVIVAAAIGALAAMVLPSFASDFETFARTLIREKGSGGQTDVTEDVRQYLNENDITDPISYLTQHAERASGPFFASDASESPSNRKAITDRGATTLYVFSNDYFRLPMATEELRILIYLDGSELVALRAYVFNTSL